MTHLLFVGCADLRVGLPQKEGQHLQLMQHAKNASLKSATRFVGIVIVKVTAILFP